MTEKRFTINSYSSYDTTTIKDNSSTRVLSVIDCVDELNYLNKVGNELYKKNEQLKDALNQRTDQCDKYYKENEQLKSENKELKAKVDDKEVAVEVECEKLMQKVLDLIDEKIKHYSHKPVSAPISQPMSVNFDADVDRLARLSELEALKEGLTR